MSTPRPARRLRAGTPDQPLVIDIYARISRETDEDRAHRRASNVDDQIADCRAEVLSRGAVVGEVYKDTSKSAWNPHVARPEWRVLMGRLAAGDADGVIVQDVTRFSRKVREGEDLLDVTRGGAHVWSMDGEYDLTTASGKRQFRDAIGDAVHESERLSERTARGKRRKAERGRSNASWRGFAMPGFAPRPSGWETGDPREMVSDEQVAAEREQLREVARRLLADQTIHAVVRWLASEGVHTVTGGPFTTQALRQMLARPSLAGILVYRDEPIGTLPGEPVLDRETWDRLQALFASRKRGPIESVYLLSNLMVCGRCGEKLSGRPRSGISPYPDGEVARQYWCSKKAHGVGCGRLAIDQRAADAIVEAQVLRALGDPRHEARMRTHLQQTATARSTAQAEIVRLDEQADALAQKVASWGLERVEVSMTTVLTARAEQVAVLAQLEAPESRASARADSAEHWEGADLAGRRAIVRRTFPRLAVMPTEGRGRWQDPETRFAWDGVEHPGI